MQCIYTKARIVAFVTSFISVCSLGILNITHAQTSTISNPALNKQAEEVASLLEGKMRTAIPAKGDYPATSVIMTTCRVRLQRPDTNTKPNSIFLYQEQAIQENLQKPYRQRLLEVSPIASTQSIRSLAFKPSNPEAWVNFCDKSLESRIISLKDLNEEVCSLFYSVLEMFIQVSHLLMVVQAQATSEVQFVSPIGLFCKKAECKLGIEDMMPMGNKFGEQKRNLISLNEFHPRQFKQLIL